MKQLLTILLVATLLPSAYALTLDSISFDPPIIASGDEVDIIIQYRQELTGLTQDRIGDPDYTFQVRLETDDDRSNTYVTVTDSRGDDVSGSILAGRMYNKVFRVKVSPLAPPGEYQLRLVGQWFENGKPQEEISQRFTMQVKKEGIRLGIASVQTSPATVRAGDEYVTIQSSVFNSGEKDARAVILTMESDEGIRPSHADGNRVYLGNVPAGDQTKFTSVVDVDDSVSSQTHLLLYTLTYEDEDGNTYDSTIEVPFVIRKSPRIVVSESSGSVPAGGNGELQVTVQNVGDAVADTVDVRLLKTSTQPFSIETRSQYVGGLAPGETATVAFPVEALRDAEQREHSMSVLIRATGDSDLGDDAVYTYTEQASFTVDGKASLPLVWIGTALVALVVFVIWRKKK